MPNYLEVGDGRKIPNTIPLADKRNYSLDAVKDALRDTRITNMVDWYLYMMSFKSLIQNGNIGAQRRCLIACMRAFKYAENVARNAQMESK